MKKRIFAAVLCGVLIAGLAGCGNTAEREGKPDSTVTADASSDNELSGDISAEPAAPTESINPAASIPEPQLPAEEKESLAEASSPEQAFESRTPAQTEKQKPAPSSPAPAEPPKQEPQPTAPPPSQPTEPAKTTEPEPPQETRRVTVISGQVATVTFNNKMKRGDLTVTKTSEDGLVEGVKFHLSGTSLSGLAVDEYAVTDSTGVAKFTDVLIGSGYVLSEVDTAIRYVIPDDQVTAVEWNKVTDNSFHNILKKFQVTVTKSDSETGTPQGDASLAGAKYGIFKGDQLIDTYTTDSSGQFTTDFYVCDSDWSIREIEPSEGYLLNETVYHVGAEPELYTIEYNLTANDVLETVKKGNIAIIKHCDDGSTQIETPEVGAEFEVYLKSAGSYDAAKDSEKDYLVCDENGFAQTKDLPYGIYTVKQTKGWEGKEMMPAFDVFVSENGQTYRYLINNATFEALIEIVKKDIETGKIIPAAGIGFKVRNADTGEYIVQHINYPTPVDIDTYYTDTTGKLMMPEKLPYGNYELIEVQTCYGYVLSAEPVPFVVDGTEAIVTVEKHNIAQKGTITVSKSGEVFSSVVESDGIYQPVYSVSGLAGAVYEITAIEDVYTLDGTLRYSAGEVVATITTGILCRRGGSDNHHRYRRHCYKRTVVPRQI